MATNRIILRRVPLSISGTPVVTGEVGVAYTGFSVVASGGTPPYTYSVHSGTLPSGLTLNSSTGAVSGTPDTEANYSSIVIRVTDNASKTADLAAFTVSIGPAPDVIPPPADLSPAGGDGSVPTESGVIHGSGCDQKVICGFDEPPYMWIEAEGHYITVGAAIGDRGWIDYVDFWLNGNVVRVSAQAKNSRTGSMGWTVNPITDAGTDGDYTLYARVVPVNGYERLLSLPITLNTNGTITRSVRYINYSTGSDSNAGTSQGAPWKSFLKATVSAPSGSIVYFEPGQTYLEDSNTGTAQSNSRLIEFRPRTVGGRATISRTSRTSPSIIWTPRCNRVLFNSVDFDMSKMAEMQASNSNNFLLFSDCTFTDTLPTYSYSTSAQEIIQTAIGGTNQTRSYCMECTFTGVVATGPCFWRNSTIDCTWDIIAFNGAFFNNNTAIFNLSAVISGQFDNRMSLENTLTIGTVAYDSGTNRTTITLSGTPTLYTLAGTTNAAAIAANSGCRFIDGPLAGTTAVLFSLNNTTKVVVVVGDYSASLAGNTIWVWQIAHADSFQFVGDSTGNANLENIYVQRYSAQPDSGDFNQPILGQRGSFTGSGTLSTSGTTVTFSATQTLKAGDFIHLTSGTVGLLKYQYRRVVSDTSNSLTATIASSFTANYDGTGGNADVPAGTTWAKGKSAKDVALVSCVLVGAVAEIAQLQHGQQHWVFAQSTILTSTLSFRNATVGFGLEGVAMLDSVFAGQSTGHTASTDSDASGPNQFPTVGITWDNNAFYSGTGRGTNSVVSGTMAFDATFHPTAGLTKQVRGVISGAVADGTPLFPWDLDGDAIVAGALVGAQQAP